MRSLYVCLFSNGCIKVGRSDNPKRRVAAHANRAGCLGVDLTQRSIFTCAGSSLVAEAKLIDRCRAAASEVRRREWFFGLHYEAVCAWAHEESLTEYVDEVSKTPLPEPTQMLQFIRATTGLSETALAKRLGISQPAVHRILHGQPGCSSNALFGILRLHAEVITEQQQAAA